jgi:hypothetical protein
MQCSLQGHSLVAAASSKYNWQLVHATACCKGESDETDLLSRQQHWIWYYIASSWPSCDSFSPVSEGFVGDPWLSILSRFCHIVRVVSHWLVLDHLIEGEPGPVSDGQQSDRHCTECRAVDVTNTYVTLQICRDDAAEMQQPSALVN